MFKRTWLVLTLLHAFLQAPAGSLEPEPWGAGESSPVWEAPQFVRADRAGGVFLFRADSFEVYPILKGGRFDKPVRLETATPSRETVRSVALSPGGDQWLIRSGDQLRLFVHRKEKALPPLPWLPWSVAFLRDTPVFTAVPLPLGGRSIDIQKLGAPAWLLRLDNDRWSTVLDLKKISVPELLASDGLNDAIAENAALFLGDRQGRLWVVRQYAYRIQRFSPGGRLLLDLVVNEGMIRKKKEAQGIDIQLSNQERNPREATSNPKAEKGTFFPFTAEHAVLGVTEGQDGLLYLLVSDGEGRPVLDRYDPGRAVLERLPLAIKLQGTCSLAAGRDALYLAAWEGKGGRWRIPWQALETAAWKEVEGVKIDGKPVAAGP